MSKTLTLLLMDPPFESANTTTAFRLIEAALRKGHTVNVFAYEGAVNLTMKGQQPHANPVHGKSFEGENHPLSIYRETSWRAYLRKPMATACGGLTAACVLMNGVLVIGLRDPGGPADFWRWASESDQTLVISCR